MFRVDRNGIGTHEHVRGLIHQMRIHVVRFQCRNLQIVHTGGFVEHTVQQRLEGESIGHPTDPRLFRNNRSNVFQLLGRHRPVIVQGVDGDVVEQVYIPYTGPNEGVELP